ncbi:MAG: aspartate 1-decarboxylase [bacterium]
MRSVIRSKIHKATVTEANIEYVGSIGIDQYLLDKAGFWPGEKVLISSLTSGARLESYIITAERGSGEICMNGSAAHLIKAGEEIIIMGFEITDKPVEAKVILVDKNNKFVKYL